MANQLLFYKIQLSKQHAESQSSVGVQEVQPYCSTAKEKNSILFYQRG